MLMLKALKAALLKLVNLFSKRLKVIRVLGIFFLIFVVFHYIHKCTTKVETVATNEVQNIEQHPIQTILHNIIPSVVPSPKPDVGSGSGGVSNPPIGTRLVSKNFRLDVHIDLGIYSSIAPLSRDFVIPKVGAGVSLLSYGYSSKDTKFRLLRIGVGGWTNTGIDLTVAPIMYNLGYSLPLISNTYIYPYVGYNIDNNKAIAGAGLSLSF